MPGAVRRAAERSALNGFLSSLIFAACNAATPRAPAAVQAPPLRACEEGVEASADTDAEAGDTDAGDGDTSPDSRSILDPSDEGDAEGKPTGKPSEWTAIRDRAISRALTVRMLRDSWLGGLLRPTFPKSSPSARRL